MKKLQVKIIGLQPGILFHRMSKEMEDKLAGAKNNKIREEIERNNVSLYIYFDSEGRPAIPSTYIINAMKNAAAEFQIKGRGKKTYKKLVGAGLIAIEPDMIPLNAPKGWKIDSRPVVVQKARIMRHRPLFPEWSAEFTIYYDEQQFTENIVKEILENAGAFVGIGDYRPERGGPFGRFKVEKK